MKLYFILLAKGLLLAFGVLQGLAFPDYDRLVLCFFLSLAASFSAPLFQKRFLQILPLALGCLLPLVYPEFMGFVPLLLFDAVILGIVPVVLPAGIALIRMHPDLPMLAAILGAGMMAALLAFIIKENASLRKTLSRMRDETEESVLAYQEEQSARSKHQDAEIYAATLAERNRIAREIHDNVGHTLSRAILQTGALKTLRREDELLQAQLGVLDQSLSEAMNAIRESVHDLYEDSIDLEQSAAALAAGFSFCPVTLTCRISSPAPRNISFCLLAIIKEALVNIRRHSSATEAQIAITEHPALWQMTIQDNGQTRPSYPEADVGNIDAFSAGRGLGLKNMQARVEQLSGSIHFSQENGFRIFVTIPKEHNRENRKEAG